MANTTFTGFPAAGVKFLRDLTANNHKTWFEAHKREYHDHVQTPALALVEAVGEHLRVEFPPIDYDLRANGSGSLMRIHRDVRFSADKSPYKTEVAMLFVAPGQKRMHSPGFGLRITPQAVDVIAGLFMFDPVQLVAYRAAVVDEAQGAALVSAAESVRAAGDYALVGRELKQVPRGFDPQHPRADWLLYKGLYASAPPIPLAVAAAPSLVTVVLEHFRAMAPIQQWLVGALGDEHQT